jgi:TPR repeat protein
VQSWGDALQKGLDAYGSRDYATALEEWLPLAELGDAEAQYFLGVLYTSGLGVTQDYLKAYMWFDISSSKGYYLSTMNKEVTAKYMSLFQVLEAQDLAKECVERDYKRC